MLVLWVLELFAMYATDGQRRMDKSNAYCPFPTGQGHNKKICRVRHSRHIIIISRRQQRSVASTRSGNDDEP